VVWVQFIVCLVIIFFAGSRLSRYGDIIAEKTGLGQVWVGMVLLATATSLPELVTGISSVALVGKPDLTVGDVFGSCLFNLAIIAIADAFYRRGPVLYHVRTSIAFSAAASVLLLALAGASIFVAQNALPFGVFNYISLFSVVILGVYLLIQWMLARFEKAQKIELAEIEEAISKYEHISHRRTYTLFAVWALAIFGAGIWLSFIGKEISEVTGLATGFVGTLFLALSTSLPEIAVTVSAIRMGAVNMGIGNVLGSNMFNIGIVLFVDDLFYVKGPLLSHISPDHIFTAFVAVLMTCVIILGLLYRPRHWPRAWVSFDAAALVLLYIGAFWVLFYLGRA